jgi:hypothetical protein
MGRIGGKTITLSEVEMAVTTKNAVVAVQSLDGNPISQSRKIMISLGARSVPRRDDSLPFYSEPLDGRILIRAPAGLRLHSRDGGSGKLPGVNASYTNARYILTLDSSFRSSWMLLDAGANKSTIAPSRH